MLVVLYTYLKPDATFFALIVFKQGIYYYTVTRLVLSLLLGLLAALSVGTE